MTNLAKPILFQIRASPAEEGDSCAYFDFATGAWSVEGVSLANSSYVTQELGEGVPGTWCQLSHLSLFAVMQAIPFDTRLGLDESRYSMGVVPVALCVCVAVGCIGFLLKRRLRPPAAGKTEIQDSQGRLHAVQFTRHEIGTQSKLSLGDIEEGADAGFNKKVLVKWDVDPDKFLQCLGWPFARIFFKNLPALLLFGSLCSFCLCALSILF